MRVYIPVPRRNIQAPVFGAPATVALEYYCSMFALWAEAAAAVEEVAVSHAQPGLPGQRRAGGPGGPYELCMHLYVHMRHEPTYMYIHAINYMCIHAGVYCIYLLCF